MLHRPLRHRSTLLLGVLGWVIIGQVILSWLVAFNVLNTSSQRLRSRLRGRRSTQITEPLYRPIRKIMPDFGGIDFSPLVLLLLIQILRHAAQRRSQWTLVYPAA